MSSTQHSDFKPVFAVGFARSGTTLLATLLGRHSQIAATPETHFIDEVYRGRGSVKSPTSASTSLLDASFSSPRIQDMALAKENVQARLEGSETDYAGIFRALLEEFAHACGKNRVLEKTPAHLPYVPLLLEWYPNAKIVCIVRDGRDAVLSNMKMPWTHDDLRRHCRIWNWCDALVDRWLRRFPESVVRIRFEDLLEDPEATLEKVHAFIGVDFEPEQLQPGKENTAIPAWENEWKQKAYGELDPQRIAAWRTTASQQQRCLMNSMMGRCLKKHGYPDTALDGCPPLQRLRNAFLNGVYNVVFCPWLKRYLSRPKRILEKAGILEPPKTAPQAEAGELRARWTEKRKKPDDPSF